MLRQSGRFAVISKSMTASPPPRGSIDATSNPRSDRVPAMSSAEALTSTNSRSQDRTSRMSSQRAGRPASVFSVSLCLCVATLVRKLFQKPQVVLVEEPDVFHLVAQDRDTFDADAPGEAGVLLRVVADSLEDGGMYHAAAADLNPAGLLAHRAAGPVTLPAAQVDFRARLGIRKEAGTEPDADRRREHLPRERQQRALQVGERNAFANHQGFDLAECR